MPKSKIDRLKSSEFSWSKKWECVNNKVSWRPKIFAKVVLQSKKQYISASLVSRHSSLAQMAVDKTSAIDGGIRQVWETPFGDFTKSFCHPKFPNHLDIFSNLTISTLQVQKSCLTTPTHFYLIWDWAKGSSVSQEHQAQVLNILKVDSLKQYMSLVLFSYKSFLKNNYLLHA